MNAQYDALVRLSQPLGYWPLGRRGWTELIGGLHFTSLPAYRLIEGDGVRLTEEAASRAVVMTATNNFSMELWVYSEQPVAGRRMFSNANYFTNGYHIAYGADATGRFRASAVGVADLSTSQRALVRHAWNHIVVVREGGTWKYYLNGEVDTANAGTNAPNAPSGGSTIVGSLAATGGVDGYRGAALYTRVLSASEVRDHYLMGSKHVGPMFIAAEVPQAEKVDDAIVYIDIQVSSAEIAATVEEATIHVDIQVTSIEEFSRYDAATVYVDIQFLGGECFSTFSGLMMDAEADARWIGDATGRWFITDGSTRWEIEDIQVEGVNC